MSNSQIIDKLWEQVEDCTWLLAEIAPIAVYLGYWDTEYDIKFERDEFESPRVNPENCYWMRNATFALLILAAEGEL